MSILNSIAELMAIDLRSYILFALAMYSIAAVGISTLLLFATRRSWNMSAIAVEAGGSKP